MTSRSTDSIAQHESRVSDGCQAREAACRATLQPGCTCVHTHTTLWRRYVYWYKTSKHRRCITYDPLAQSWFHTTLDEASEQWLLSCVVESETNSSPQSSAPEWLCYTTRARETVCSYGAMRSNRSPLDRMLVTDVRRSLITTRQNVRWTYKSRRSQKTGAARTCHCRMH